MSELTLELLDEAIQKIQEQRDVIVGVVVSPNDYYFLKEGSKRIMGWDTTKIFDIALYKGIAVYVSEMVEDGKPIPLVRKRGDINHA